MHPSEIGAQAPYPLDPLDLAATVTLGFDAVPALAQAGPVKPPTMRQALESIVAQQLKSRKPVFVAFSGGRDSSAVLAVAAAVCRRHGAPMPRAITIVAEAAPASREDDWQRLVLDHLELPPAALVRATSDTGMLDARATELLQLHGLLAPPNIYQQADLLEQCRGGTVLTGVGGDEFFDSEPSDTSGTLLRGFRHTIRLAASVIVPAALDRRRERYVPQLSWLSEAGQEELARRVVIEKGRPYQSTAQLIRRFARARSLQALRFSSAALGGRHGVELIHPFFHESFIQAAARESGIRGFRSRERAMRMLAGDLLPEVVLQRRTKAHFTELAWTSQTLAKLRAPEMIDAVASDPSLASLIDIDGLHREWSDAEPSYLTALLAQACWLSLHHR